MKDEKKDKGEHIRGRDLKISENDILRSLPFFGRVRAWIFGGVYGIRDSESKMPRVVVVFLPSAPMRFYYRHFYKHKTLSKEGKENE